MYRVFVLAFSVWIVCSVGCTVVPSKNPDLDEAKTIYHNINAQQNPSGISILREDWPSKSKMALNSYKYIIPHFPYFFYNFLMVGGKEGLTFLASPIIGGTRHQDLLDQSLSHSYVSYEKLYNGLWSDEHANFINMDDYDIKKLDTIFISKEKKNNSLK